MYFLNRRGVLIIAITIGCSHASRPYIDSASPYTSFLEEFNGTVWRFHVTDPDKGDSLKLRPLDNITAQYFSIDQLGDGNGVWVNVTLNRPLDREILGPEVTARFSITDNQHNEIKMVHTLDIFDVNDNRPEFEYWVYTFGINELPCNKTTVYTKIHATDSDSGENARIGYSMSGYYDDVSNKKMPVLGSKNCETNASTICKYELNYEKINIPNLLDYLLMFQPNTKSSELRKMYNDTFSVDPVNGYVTLNKCLDYETNDFYNYTVMAKDFGPNGGLNSTAVLTIYVKDVKDESSVITG